MKVRDRRQSSNSIRKNIKIIAQENNLSEQVQFVLANLFDYMMEKRFAGGCHALSSVLYVALSELGETPELYAGECFNPRGGTFDHSWILLNGKVVDIAIYVPLPPKFSTISMNGSIIGVVIMDIDTATMKKCDTVYGFKTGLKFGYETEIATHMPFVEYMDVFPFESNGLWSVVKRVLPDTIQFDMGKVKEKYVDTKRIFV